MKDTAPDFEYLRNFLKQELELRKARNQKYSLRDFARDLNLSPATLYQIIIGQQEISQKTYKKLKDKLILPIKNSEP